MISEVNYVLFVLRESAPRPKTISNDHDDRGGGKKENLSVSGMTPKSVRNRSERGPAAMLQLVISHPGMARYWAIVLSVY